MKNFFLYFLLVSILTACFGSKILIDEKNNHVYAEEEFQFSIEGPDKCRIYKSDSCVYEIFDSQDRLSCIITLRFLTHHVNWNNGTGSGKEIISTFYFLNAGISFNPKVFNWSRVNKRNIALILMRNEIFTDGKLNLINCRRFIDRHKKV